MLFVQKREKLNTNQSNELHDMRSRKNPEKINNVCNTRR